MRFGLLLLLWTCSSMAFGAETASSPAPSGPATAPADAIAPAPADADIAAQQQTIRTLYKTDYASRDPAKRSELAQQLIQLSASGTPAERIALLREAMVIAAGSGDLDLAHTAYDAIVQNWAVDADGERLAMYKAAVVTTPDQAESAASDLLAASTSAINADDYTSAQKLAEAAGGFARKADDEALGARIKTVANEARDLGSEYYHITDKADMLGNLTPAQHTALGRFYAMSKCDWGKALPQLADGDDATLKALAVDDVAAKTGADHEAIGERWIAYAKKVPSKQRPGLIRRGLDHLTQASDAATGLAKARLDKRIADLQDQAGNERGGGPALPPGVVLWLSGDAGPDGRDPVDAGPAQLPVQVEGKLQLLREGHGGFMRFSGKETVTVALKTPIPANSPLTLACWLRYAGKAPRGSLWNLPGDGFIVAEDHGASLNIIPILDLASKQQLDLRCSANGVKAWHQLVFVLDPLKNSLWYVDGEAQEKTVKLLGPLAASFDQVQLGCGWEKLIGDMDSVGVWKRALSADEIKALYTAESSGRPAP
jgi:hypothetical protein